VLCSHTIFVSPAVIHPTPDHVGNGGQTQMVSDKLSGHGLHGTCVVIWIHAVCYWFFVMKFLLSSVICFIVFMAGYHECPRGNPLSAPDVGDRDSLSETPH
jgi:hypothetical protein